MSDDSVPRHEWPEEEPRATEVPPTKQGRITSIPMNAPLTIGA